MTDVPRTQVMVVVDAEPGMRSAIEDVELLVRGGQGRDEVSSFTTRLDEMVPGPIAWPISVALVPLDGDATRIYFVEATAVDAAGATIARVRAISGYVPRETRVLRLIFEDDCRDQLCAGTETCVDAACRPSNVATTDLLPITALDGSVGTVDGGQTDGPGLDAPRDAATDGGPGDGGDDSGIPPDQIVEVEGGYAHFCARRRAGRVSCFGSTNMYGELGVTGVPGVSDGLSLAVGESFSCARSSGLVGCWGRNDMGQLGNGTLVMRDTASPVAGVGATDWVYASRFWACAGDATETRCWGGIPSVAFGISCPSCTVPMPVGELTGVELLSGWQHLCRVRGGALSCAGVNFLGQLGDGSRTDHPTFTAPIATGVVSVAAGEFSTCYVTSSRRIFCVGDNGYGQLGSGGVAHMDCRGMEDTVSRDCSPTPVEIAVPMPVQVAGTRLTFCARSADGSVWCWGDDYFDTVGRGSGSSEVCIIYDSSTIIRCAHSPTRVAGIDDAVDIAMDTIRACALRSTGVVECWGYDFGAVPTPRSLP